VTNERVHELLDRLGNLLRAENRRFAAAHGLQPVHLQALAFLTRANRYSDSPISVAEYLGTTKGTVSQTLARLEEKGLVSTRPDRVDGRRVRLSVTAKGRRLLARQGAEPLCSVPSPRLAETLSAPLEQLLIELQRARGGRSFGVCRTCRHFENPGTGVFHCGLTGEPLSVEQSTRLCREHA
jgi:DNA-binding MarR family transcriptional regulator